MLTGYNKWVSQLSCRDSELPRTGLELCKPASIHDRTHTQTHVLANHMPVAQLFISAGEVMVDRVPHTISQAQLLVLVQFRMDVPGDVEGM